MKSILIAALFSLLNCDAFGMEILSLYSTGQGSAIGGLDKNYFVTANFYQNFSGENPTVIEKQSSWANIPGSQWVSLQTPLEPAIRPSNGYFLFYNTNFDLTGYNRLTADISGSWASSSASLLYLNDNLIRTNSVNPSEATGFTLPIGFLKPGINSLKFAVAGDFSSVNAVSVRLSGTAQMIPEPRSTILTLAGIVVIAIKGLKNRKWLKKTIPD